MSIIFLCILFGLSVVTAATEQFLEAAVGTTVILPCKSDQNSSIVIWNHFPFGAILSNIVYLNELYPSPQSCASNSSDVNIIGKNSCKIEPDIVSLNCTLRYQGNFQPVLDWKSSAGALVTSTLKSTDYRTTVSTVVLKADEQRNAKYMCSVKYLDINLVSSFSCSLEINVITLFSQTREYNPECDTESVPCSVNATNDCSYTWVNNKSEEVASGSTLFLQNHQVGNYICKADCLFRKTHRCLFEPVKVNSTCCNGKHTSLGVVGVVLGVALAVAISIVVILLYRKFRMKKKKSNALPTEKAENERLNEQTERKQEDTV